MKYILLLLVKVRSCFPKVKFTFKVALVTRVTDINNHSCVQYFLSSILVIDSVKPAYIRSTWSK